MTKLENLVTGDRIPTKQQIGVASAISRPTLRKDLRVLRVMAAPESWQVERYKVTDLSSRRLVEPSNKILSMALWYVDEYLDARVIKDFKFKRLYTGGANLDLKIRKIELANQGQVFYNDQVAFRLLDVEFSETIKFRVQSPLLAIFLRCLYDLEHDLMQAVSGVQRVIRTPVENCLITVNAIMILNLDSAVATSQLYLKHIYNVAISVKINSIK